MILVLFDVSDECFIDDKIVAFMHTSCKSAESKRDFIKQIKYMWKNFSEESENKPFVLKIQTSSN